MRRIKNRIRKKIYSKVVKAQILGAMNEYYAKRAARLISIMMDYKYNTEFRPWWYEQDWSVHPLEKEVPEFFKKAFKEIETITGIDINQLNDFLKQFPIRPNRERKPRIPKLQPIRKLRNPETFQITVRQKDKTIVKQDVIGEKAFELKGYHFFIHYDKDICWVISDVLEGKRINSSTRYNEAINDGKELMKQYIDEYIKRIKATPCVEQLS